tara:strand:- start:3460 stop:3624 length:165 start_codon:yes stop_codon:yes gene_type:complete
MKSKGLGDSIAKVTKATGIQQFVKKTFQKDCGCGKRQKQLNELFPYSQNNKKRK